MQDVPRETIYCVSPEALAATSDTERRGSRGALRFGLFSDGDAILYVGGQPTLRAPLEWMLFVMRLTTGDLVLA